MEHIVLLLANLAVYFLLTCKIFTLYEGILSGKHYGIIFQLFIGLINAALMAAMAINLPISLSYAIIFFVLFFEICIVFRRPLMEMLTVTVATVMCVMCIRGIIISTFALAMGRTISAIKGSPDIFLFALLTSNAVEWLLLFVVMRLFSLEDVRVSLGNKAQTLYMLIWAILCVGFMFKSLQIYEMDNLAPFMIFEHLTFCSMLLLSFFYLVAYTFSLGKTTVKHKSLSKALGNQIELQSAITRDATYVAHANLTHNLIISGLEVYGEALDFLNNNYDAWFEFAKSKVHPHDYEGYFQCIERNSLLKSFEQGIEPRPFEYRRLGRDNEYHWVRSVVRMFRDFDTNDVHIFGYAFDIDNEVRERQMLEHSAQTDLFTGLYNKLTTETIIGEEIKKGTGILISLDIDDFKNVNDRYGHEAGDFVLKFFAKLLKETFRKGDIIGRIGGDEFMVYIKDTTDLSLAEDRASEIMTHLKTTAIEYFDKRIFISVSIGIALIGEDIDSFSEAYKKVDGAMYQAKQSGKNAFFISDDKVKSPAV